MKQKKLIINLLLSLLVLILLLSILELAVSVYYNVKYKDILYLSGKKTVIDNQPYSVKSHYIYNTTLNSDGFRDREISIIKKKIRIAILGDSFTFGVGINDTNNTYPKVLEKNLQDIEVINFGLPGSNFLDIYWTLKYRVLKYQPDIVMYGFYENDNAFSDNNVDYPFCRYMGLNNRLNIITFIESKLNNIMTNLIFLGYYYDDSILLYFPSWNCFDNVLEEIKWMSEKNNFTFIVFTIPHHTSPNPVAITLKNQINGRVKKNNLLVIENFVDLFWEKTENITDYELRVNREEKPHFNEMGHKIIAGVLYEHLTKNILKNET